MDNNHTALQELLQAFQQNQHHPAPVYNDQPVWPWAPGGAGKSDTVSDPNMQNFALQDEQDTQIGIQMNGGDIGTPGIPSPGEGVSRDEADTKRGGAVRYADGGGTSFKQRWNALQDPPGLPVGDAGIHGVPQLLDKMPKGAVYNDQPTDQQVSRDRASGQAFTKFYGLHPPDPDLNERASFHRVDPNASYAKGGKVKNDPVNAVIRKLGGGGLAPGERSFIPRPPRLGNLGHAPGMGGAGMRPPHVGMIHSVVPGRTDQLPMHVRGGSYVVPADVISGVGQGNSMAGANAFNKLFKMGPYGAATNQIATPKVNMGRMGNMSAGPMHAPAPVQKLGDMAAGGGMHEGGTPGQGQPVPIIAAGGEFVIPEDKVREIGGGDMTRGHDILDKLILRLRKKTIDETRKLKGPKRD